MVQVWVGCLISAPDYAFPQEKEKLYVELKHILARQPGPEAAEQLQIYRYTLQEKTKQLKVSPLLIDRMAALRALLGCSVNQSTTQPAFLRVH